VDGTLKVDCELCEWFCYQEFLQAVDVQQILIETHNPPLRKQDQVALPSHECYGLF
jgi:hypothetical protein